RSRRASGRTPSCWTCAARCATPAELLGFGRLARGQRAAGRGQVFFVGELADPAAGQSGQRCRVSDVPETGSVQAESRNRDRVGVAAALPHAAQRAFAAVLQATGVAVWISDG